MMRSFNAVTVQVVFQRDLIRFFREKTRIAGALIQPLIFWLVIGRGMSGITRVNYNAYFFPGVLIMIVLFSSIFTTMSVIEDKQNGFLQGVMVGPGSRGAMVLGKCFGSATIGMIQALAFALLAPWAGFSIAAGDAVMLFAMLYLASIALCATGFCIAWMVQTTQAYHVLMSIVLMPAWIVSGAIFPLPNQGLAGALAQLNPLTHFLNIVRATLLHQAIPRLSFAMALAFFLAMYSLATLVAYKAPSPRKT